MSGRHRKPTTSSVGIAKIALTGAVLSSGSIGLAAQAQAATDSEWDTVANCESSGNWAINTGNGYHGGLQFAPSTWLGYGGGEFASAAYLATRDEQIVIAEKVLAGQGKGAWPSCGRGLSGPTPRSAPTEAADTAAATETPENDVAAVPLDAPADAPAPAEVPAPASALDTPPPAAPADLQDAPAPALPDPSAAPPAPEPEIITIAETTVAPDETGAPGDPAAPGMTIVQASLPGEVPLAPADPAVPPADTAAPGDSATPATPATPAGDVVAVASDQLPTGVPHLPSPDSLPPGTSAEPVGPASNPNVSYIKDLWQALRNDEIDRDELIVALGQRRFTAPIPGDASTAPSLVVDPAADPALAPAADPALVAEAAAAAAPAVDPALAPAADPALVAEAADPAPAP